MSEPGDKYKPNICRLCLSQTLTTFSLINNDEPSEMLEALTSLRILPADEISTVMCLKCHLNLKLAFNIQQNMLKAEQKFRERYFPPPIKQEYDFQDIEELKDSLNETPIGDWICDICGTVKSTKQNLRHHKYNVHMTKKCPICNEDKKLTKFKSHVDNCKKRSICKQEFPLVKIEPISVEEIVINAEKVDLFTCDICGAAKSSKLNLQRHKYNVHMYKRCPKCIKNVKLTKFKYHVENCEALSKRLVENQLKKTQKIQKVKKIIGAKQPDGHTIVKCPICSKELTKVNLKRHIERHSESYTVCEICGKSVLSQDLRSHNHYNHRGTNFKCRFCEKTYKKRVRTLEHEQKEHLNEANFVCDTCGRKFYKKRDLKRHIEGKHLKLRPYVCDFCNVGFSSNFALTTHRRQHTNEKPYKCDVCGEGFRQKVSLRGHLKSKHNIQEELTCECTVCGKKFASKVALFSHSRIH